MSWSRGDAPSHTGNLPSTRVPHEAEADNWLDHDPCGAPPVGRLSAHHAVRRFDTTTPIRVKGTVVRYTWANPHSVIIVQKAEGGETIR